MSDKSSVADQILDIISCSIEEFLKDWDSTEPPTHKDIYAHLMDAKSPSAKRPRGKRDPDIDKALCKSIRNGEFDDNYNKTKCQHIFQTGDKKWKYCGKRGYPFCSSHKGTVYAAERTKDGEFDLEKARSDHITERDRKIAEVLGSVKPESKTSGNLVAETYLNEEIPRKEDSSYVIFLKENSQFFGYVFEVSTVNGEKTYLAIGTAKDENSPLEECDKDEKTKKTEQIMAIVNRSKKIRGSPSRVKEGESAPSSPATMSLKERLALKKLEQTQNSVK